MKSKVSTVDATPSKRLYLSIIADYDLNKAICELIDNAIDIWVMNGKVDDLSIFISLDQNQQRIDVVDDAGGLSESDLVYIVGPGHTRSLDTDQTIGIFGVGTKRAVVALAQNVTIRTRQDAATHAIEFDDDWINEGDDWKLPVYQVDDIGKGTTHIQLIRLRKSISDDAISNLNDHLGVTYAQFLSESKLGITLNGRGVEPINFEDWAFPPGFEPRRYFGEIPSRDGAKVSVRAVAGLIKESSPAGGEYGVYVYCNDRLVAGALKTYAVGFGKGLAGKPHADIALARVILYLNGQARLMCQATIRRLCWAFSCVGQTTRWAWRR
jgi:hypothetical protein